MAYYTRDCFAPDVSVGYLAKRIYQLSALGLEPLFAEEGATLTQWSALVSIHFGRGGTCAELARDLTYDKGATTRLVDALEAKGWVRRERDSDDRRVANLVLTDDGEAVALRCRARVVEQWNRWLADWSREDIDSLIAQLQRLRDTIEREAAA